MTTPAPPSAGNLCGTGEYRLLEAIESVMSSEPMLIHYTGDGTERSHENKTYRIAAGYPTTIEKTPFIAIVVNDTVPQDPENPNTGWQVSDVTFISCSRDEILCTLMSDWIVKMLTDPASNTEYLDFTNAHIMNSGTKFTGRDRQYISKTRENEGKDTHLSFVMAEVIWLDTPCDGDCEFPDQEVCDETEDCEVERDC